jgi:cell division protein FtsQ
VVPNGLRAAPRQRSRPFGPGAAAAGAEPPDSVPRSHLGLAAALAGLVAAAALGLHTRPFLLSHLRVTGMRQVTPAEVEADLALPAGTYSWQVRPWILQARLERDPLVRRARVSILWPNGLQVALVERVPAALILSGSQAWEVDAAGRLLRALPGAQAAQPVPGLGRPLPPIVGVALPDPQPGQVVRSAVLGRALAVAAALGGTFPGQVAEVTAAADGSVGLRLRSGVSVIYGDGSDARLKTEELLGALAYFRQHGEAVTACDVSSTRTPACTLAGTGT